MLRVLGKLACGLVGGAWVLLGGPAGTRASWIDTPVTLMSPSLAASPGSACAALAVRALAKVTAANVAFEGVAETVLASGNTTDAFSAKYAPDRSGVRVVATVRGATAMLIAADRSDDRLSLLGVKTV